VKILRALSAIIIYTLVIIASPNAKSLEDGRLGLFDARISPDGNRAAFSWSGDIWIAEIPSGVCTRVTDHIAYDHHPVWFPDGKRIAFSSNRDGNDDVFSVPVTGGEPTKHTWYNANDIVMDVAPDGEHILFRSFREAHGIDLYEVDTHGGLERALTKDTSRNLEARYSPDGKSIVVARGIFDWLRRGYHGSADTDLYVMDRDGSNMRWVENGYDGIDYWPAFTPNGKSILFMSDRDGCENIYSIPSTGGPATQITNYKDRPVQFISVASTGRILFVQDFRLRYLDPQDNGSDKKTLPIAINLNCATEPKHSQDIRLDIAGAVTEMEMSPTGKHLALISHGELYIVPLHDPDQPAPLGDARYWEAVRTTETPSRELSVSWHPDGDKVVLVSDKDGNQEVYEIDLRTFKWTRLTNSSPDEDFPKYSPDGTLLAYFRGNTELVVREIKSGSEHVVAKDLFIPFVNQYGWSPDSRYIAFTGDDGSYTTDVFVVPIKADGTGSKPVNVTVHHDSDDFAGWAKDGKSLYFMSDRDFENGLSGWGTWRGKLLYTLPLTVAPSPRSDLIVFDDKPKDESPSSAVQIDFNRITERSMLVSPTRGSGNHSALSPDCKTYVYESDAFGPNALWSVGFNGDNPSRITDTGRVNDIEWIPDNRGVIYLADGRVSAWIKASGSVTGVPTKGRLTVDLQKERREMIYEAGRMLRNHFYDPKMHGKDWDAAINLYAPLVEEAATPEEFKLLMGELLSELNASHLGCSGPNSNEGIGENVADLGIEFDPNTSGPGMKVTYILPRGPVDFAEIKIKVGEWVLKINGTDVSPAMNYWSLLDDMYARTTVLSVASDQNGTGVHDVAIGPIPVDGGDKLHIAWSTARYKAWVETNRAYVDKVSGGRIGYVHIPSMSGRPLEEFTRQLFSENENKEALIVDIRWNPGGNIHENLLDILSRPQFAWSKPRDTHIVQQPSRRWGRPTVLLINERSTSDSEIFPDGFRALNLGTIIGETTAGAVIGTDEFDLIDGATSIRLPIEGWYTLDLKNLENLGVKPDIRVVNDMNKIRDGIDEQLDAAIKNLLDKLSSGK
jgi:tricorn protease